jgi:hypothetical protein
MKIRCPECGAYFLLLEVIGTGSMGYPSFVYACLPPPRDVSESWDSMYGKNW